MSYFEYLFSRYEEEWYKVTIDDENSEHFSCIDHILENIYPKINDAWTLVAWGGDVNTSEEAIECSFIEFIEPSELINDNYSFDSRQSFNEIFFELDDELLQKLINYYHTQYVLEDLDEEEAEAYRLIMELGPKSIAKKNVKFNK